MVIKRFPFQVDPCPRCLRDGLIRSAHGSPSMFWISLNAPQSDKHRWHNSLHPFLVIFISTINIVCSLYLQLKPELCVIVKGYVFWHETFPQQCWYLRANNVPMMSSYEQSGKFFPWLQVPSFLSLACGLQTLFDQPPFIQATHGLRDAVPLVITKC